MCGGAWPFLVGGLICLVDSDNERDLYKKNTREEGEKEGEGAESGEEW